jgi:hypothetical protein
MVIVFQPDQDGGPSGPRFSQSVQHRGRVKAVD